MQKHIPAPKERMVRKQIYITAEQDQRLKERAREQGIAAASVIRLGLQRELDARQPADDAEARKARLLRIKPIWKDRDTIHEEMQELRRGWGRRLKRLGLAPKAKE